MPNHTQFQTQLLESAEKDGRLALARMFVDHDWGAEEFSKLTELLDSIESRVDSDTPPVLTEFLDRLRCLSREPCADQLVMALAEDLCCIRLCRWYARERGARCPERLLGLLAAYQSAQDAPDSQPDSA